MESVSLKICWTVADRSQLEPFKKMLDEREDNKLDLNPYVDLTLHSRDLREAIVHGNDAIFENVKKAIEDGKITNMECLRKVINPGVVKTLGFHVQEDGTLVTAET